MDSRQISDDNNKISLGTHTTTRSNVTKWMCFNVCRHILKEGRSVKPLLFLRDSNPPINSMISLNIIFHCTN